MSTPTETSPTQRHVDEVLESLERASTLLKRRTRDVLKLAYEREELMAAIENRVARVAPATLEPDHGAAIHGESVAPAPNDVTATATAPSDHHDVEPTAEVVAPESKAIPEPAQPAGAGVPEATAPEPIAAASDEPRGHESPPPPTSEFAPDVHTSPGPGGIATTEAGEATDATVADPPVAGHTPADTTESGFASKWGSPAPESYDVAPSEIASAPAEAPAQPASPTDDWHPEPEITGHSETPAEEASSKPSWEEPDLEWSDDGADVAPHTFPHPMPPVDASVLETADEYEAIADSSHDGADAGWGKYDDDLSVSTEDAASTGDFDDSPFAAEFEEHVEEVGGSLESSPFDLDTPPQPASYRPRSLQGDRSTDAMTASDLLDDPIEAEAGVHEVENVEAAWDDFAGDKSPSPASDRHQIDDRSHEPVERAEPAPSGGGSRLRDLVAKAQEEERARTEQERSDFDLINEDPTVSRYDKNSAKLPTVGISSEELSSSVASLRSSFTSDKKSGSSSRDDDSRPTRADKKADKRAAKEAAKAAKAEAKRSRRQRS